MPSPVSTQKAPGKHADVHMRGHNALLFIDSIEGFSQYADKAIDIISMEFVIGTEKAVGTKSASASSARVNFEGLKVRKHIDKASPLLFKALAEHTQIKDVGIHLYRDAKAGGKESEHYMSITLGDVYVSRQVFVDPEGSEAGGIPYEEVTFTANSVEINHIIAKKVAGIMLTQGG